MAKIPTDCRKELLMKMKEIDRLDLWGVPDCKLYWMTIPEEGEELTCDKCIDFLIKIYPVKKIDDKIIKGDDPYQD